MRQVRTNGFSLIEVVFVISLLGLIASVGALSFSPVLDSWTLGSVRREAMASLEYALDRMKGEIAQIKDPTSVISASASSLQFIDVADNNITYSLAGTNLLRNGGILARDVQSLAFTYWNLNDQTIASPAVAPSATDLWRVGVKIVGQTAGQTNAMEGQVRPRNLPRPQP